MVWAQPPTKIASTGNSSAAAFGIAPRFRRGTSHTPAQQAMAIPGASTTPVPKSAG